MKRGWLDCHVAMSDCTLRHLVIYERSFKKEPIAVCFMYRKDDPGYRIILSEDYKQIQAGFRVGDKLSLTVLDLCIGIV